MFRDSRRDLPLQNNGVKQMLRRLGRQTGVPKVHAHRFRHTFATWAIENQARELDVQHLLGHSTPVIRPPSSSPSHGSQNMTPTAPPAPMAAKTSATSTVLNEMRTVI
ncbi:MAG: site-specific integrase [Gemmatimonadota bacterium]